MARICKILVVEDNDGIRELLHDLFDDEGYEIAIVAGGRQMRGALEAHRFDVAVIDVTLPGADDGFALAALAHAADCGVILVTGDLRRFDAVQQSGHRFLLKPFRLERLLAIVRELIEHADCAVARRRHG